MSQYIRTSIRREVPTHIVSFWRRGHRIIIAVEAYDDEDAIRRATEDAGEADPGPSQWCDRCCTPAELRRRQQRRAAQEVAA